VIVETGGIGYEVFIPLSTYYRLPRVEAESNWKSGRSYAKTP